MKRALFSLLTFGSLAAFAADGGPGADAISAKHDDQMEADLATCPTGNCVQKTVAGGGNPGASFAQDTVLTPNPKVVPASVVPTETSVGDKPQ